MGYSSLILKNEEDSEKLLNLISNKIKINNMKIIYRASRDGDRFKHVVEKLNNKSNLIFIYLTVNLRIFGNYLKVKLEDLGKESNKYYEDETSINRDNAYLDILFYPTIIFCLSVIAFVFVSCLYFFK